MTATPLRRLAPPPSQMLAGLAEARQRGDDFEEAWRWAFRAIKWPHDTTQRRQWKVALEGTREEWEASYERTPTATAHLMSSISYAMAVLEEAERFNDELVA